MDSVMFDEGTSRRSFLKAAAGGLILSSGLSIFAPASARAAYESPPAPAVFAQIMLALSVSPIFASTGFSFDVRNPLVATARSPATGSEAAALYLAPVVVNGDERTSFFGGGPGPALEYLKANIAGPRGNDAFSLRRPSYIASAIEWVASYLPVGRFDAGNLLTVSGVR